jgi:hypothetical protein
MTTKDFIDQAIGKMVYVTGDRDLAFNGDLRKIIFNKIIHIPFELLLFFFIFV